MFSQEYKVTIQQITYINHCGRQRTETIFFEISARLFGLQAGDELIVMMSPCVKNPDAA